VISPAHIEEIVSDNELSVTAEFKRVRALLARSTSEDMPDDIPAVAAAVTYPMETRRRTSRSPSSSRHTSS